jgi:F-type H+-transporting ATPase subunit delta
MSKQSEEIATGIWEYLKKEKKTDLLPEVIASLKAKVSESSLTVSVKTAKALTDEEKGEISEMIMEKWNTKFIEFGVDATLLGGMKIQQGDKVLDLSVRAKLEGIYEQI